MLNRIFVTFSETIILLFTFHSFIIILCSTNITCDRTLSHSMVFLFFLTFNGSIFTSSSTNITSNNTFIIFGGTFIFYPHLTVPY